YGRGDDFVHEGVHELLRYRSSVRAAFGGAEGGAYLLHVPPEVLAVVAPTSELGEFLLGGFYLRVAGGRHLSKIFVRYLAERRQLQQLALFLQRQLYPALCAGYLPL